MEHLGYMKIPKTIPGKLVNMVETKKGILENSLLSLVCFLLLKNHLYIIMYVDIHISEDNSVELFLFFHLYVDFRD